QSFINSALSFREEQRLLLKNDSTKRLGDVITLNITKVEGGVQVNVLPENFTLLLDIRIPPTADFEKMEERIASWCTKAGPDVTFEYILCKRPDPNVLCFQKTEISAVTPTNGDDPFWSAFKKSLEDEKCKFEKEIFTGATDSRFVRELGYRSIGFSPMINTPSLLHDHNEYLNEAVFLRGVEIYETLIDNLASVEDVWRPLPQWSPPPDNEEKKEDEKIRRIRESVKNWEEKYEKRLSELESSMLRFAERCQSNKAELNDQRFLTMTLNLVRGILYYTAQIRDALWYPRASTRSKNVAATSSASEESLADDDKENDDFKEKAAN
ncbi:hypothetical protein TELCIR_14170, partial [Teladorsagia circumcincta]